MFKVVWYRRFKLILKFLSLYNTGQRAVNNGNAPGTSMYVRPNTCVKLNTSAEQWTVNSEQWTACTEGGVVLAKGLAEYVGWKPVVESSTVELGEMGKIFSCLR